MREARREAPEIKTGKIEQACARYSLGRNTIEASVPEEQRQVLLQMMAEHCYIVERSGFAAGFKTAAELWKELE